MLPGYSVLLSMTPHLLMQVLQGQQPKLICEFIFLDMATGAQRGDAMPQVTQLMNAGAGTCAQALGPGFFPPYFLLLQSLGAPISWIRGLEYDSWVPGEKHGMPILV